MKVKLKMILLVIISTLMLMGGLFFAINARKENINYFYAGGYIINNTYETSKVKTNKEYFEADIAYQSKSDDKYIFRNTAGQNVIVSEKSFVHYSDGSVMGLKDGVAIDLDKIDFEILNYYNIFEGSVLQKKDDKYQINNLNDTIVFNKLLFKISDSKYLLASNNIVISFSDGQTVSVKDFVEIEYVDENVIRIYNDKINYQTISSNLYIICDNVSIDVAYKTVSKNGVDLLAMANMVINANDNIEVIEKNEETSAPNSSDNQNNGNTQNSGNINIGGSSGGTGGSSVDESIKVPTIVNPGTQPDEDDTEFVQPSFKVVELEPTTETVWISMRFEDVSEVLEEISTIELVENSTGKVIELDAWPIEQLDYEIEVMGLNASSAYTINVKGTYVVDEKTYNRTFVSKIFRTNDLGLNIFTDYITENDIKFVVEKLENSDVKTFDYVIKENNQNIVCSGKAGEISGDGVISFDENRKAYLTCIDPRTNELFEFNANTNYTLELSMFEYDNLILNQTLTKSFTSKTLKYSEFLSALYLDYQIDYSGNLLKLIPTGTNDDRNSGIVNYIYKICSNISNVESNDCEVLITRESGSPNGVSINLNDLRKTGYDSFRIKMETRFDDNEKTIVNRVELNDVISIGEKIYPIVVGFDTDGVSLGSTIEDINGKIIIKDEDEFLLANQTSDYKIVLKEKRDPNSYTSSYDGQIVSEEQIIASAQNEYTIVLPVHFDNIIPSYDDNGKKIEKKYDMYVYVKTSGTNEYTYIGYTTYTAPVPEEIQLKVNQNKAMDGLLFDFNVELDKDKQSKSIGILDKLVFYLQYENNGVFIDSGYYREITPEQLNLIKTCDSNSNCVVENIKSNFFSSDKNNGVFDIGSILVNKKYRLNAVGYGNNENGIYPIVVNLVDENGKTFELKMATPKPTLILNKSYLKAGNQTGYESGKTLLENTVVGYTFKFTHVANADKDKLKDVSYEIYEIGEITNWGSSCSSELKDYECLCGEFGSGKLSKTNLGIDEESRPLIEGEVPDSKDFSISVDKYNGTEANSIQRGKKYCIIYSAKIYDYLENEKQGDENDTIVKSGSSLTPPKQKTIFKSGYLMNYYQNEDKTKEKIKFVLEVNDIDLTGIVGVTGTGTEKKLSEGIKKSDQSDIYSKYEYDFELEGTNGSIILKQEDSLTSTTLYNFELGGIKKIEVSEVNATVSSYNVTLNISLVNSSEEQLKKILGIGCKYNGQQVILPIDKSDNKISMVVPAYDIKSYDFIKTVEDQEKGNGVEIDWSKLSLVYDSNEINMDFSTESTRRFITKHMDPNEYLNVDQEFLKEEKGISINEQSSFIWNDFGIFQNIGFGYKISLDSSNIPVHYHLVSELNIDKPTGKYFSNSSEELQDIIATTAIKEMYGIKTAIISFNIKNQPEDMLLKDTNFKIEVEGYENVEEIVDVSVNSGTNTVFVKFTFPGDSLKYSIKYCDNSNNCNTTYNSGFNDLNEKLTITSLKNNETIKNTIANLSYSLGKTSGWRAIEESNGKSIKFSNPMTVSFKFRNNIYFETGEEIKLFAKLRNANSPEDYHLLTDCDFLDNINIKNIDNYSSNNLTGLFENVNTSTGIECTYELTDIENLKSGQNYFVDIYYKDKKDEIVGDYFKGNDKISLVSKSPTMTFGGSYSSGYKIQLDDPSGTLISCLKAPTGGFKYKFNGSVVQSGENYDFVENLYKDFVVEVLQEQYNTKTLKNYFYNNSYGYAGNYKTETPTEKREYSDILDEYIDSMYYFSLIENYMNQDTVKFFSAVPFNRTTVSVDVKKYLSAGMNKKNNATYKIVPYYCTKDSNGNSYFNVDYTEKHDVIPEDGTLLEDAEVYPADSKTNTIMFINIKNIQNPTEFMSKIARITYQVTLVENSDIFSNSFETNSTSKPATYLVTYGEGTGVVRDIQMTIPINRGSGGGGENIIPENIDMITFKLEKYENGEWKTDKTIEYVKGKIYGKTD